MTSDLPARIATRLITVDGVVAVALGGSHARGTADAHSDVDLGLYYRPATRPSRAALNRLAQELDDRHPADAVTAFGEWGPWIDGGAWLEIEGRRVDWLFSDLDLVERTLAECGAGRPRCDYQIGHPHAFHAHMLLARVHYGRPLADPGGVLAALQSRVAVYPPLLRRTLVDRFLFEAAFALDTARKSVARADVFHATGSFFRTAACLVQVLFALNRRYFLNEKNALRETTTLEHVPPDFAPAIEAILAHAGHDAPTLTASLDSLEALVAAVRALTIRIA